MQNCTVSYKTIIQMMQQWPLLKEWEVSFPTNLEFLSNSDLDLLNQQIFTTRKANLESITLDIFLGYDSFGDPKYFLDVLLSCCNVAELRVLVLYTNGWPPEYSQRLLQSIPNMHQMNTLHLKEKTMQSLLL